MTIDEIHKRFAEVDGPDWREKQAERIEMIAAPVSTGMTYRYTIERADKPWWCDRAEESE